jgi:hypothetical protein
MVAVEGARKINLACMGHGSPTVLLDHQPQVVIDAIKNAFAEHR